MNILLTGATGFVGRHLRQALEAAGHRVTPVSRRDGVDMSALRSSSNWRPLLDGIDVTINAVGIIGETKGQTFDVLHTAAPVALFKACVDAGVRRVVQVSALGADERAFSAYHRSKLAADDVLRGLPLDWFILRPSLIHGADGGSATVFLKLASLPVIPLVGDGQQQIQPVLVEDVVDTVMACLTSPDARQTIDVVGPEPMAFEAWLQRLRAAQGHRPALTLHVPEAFAMAGAAVAGLVSPLARPENLRMLRQGNVSDPAVLTRFLGRPPRALTPERLVPAPRRRGAGR